MGALGPLPPPLPLLLLMLGKRRAHPGQLPGWRPRGRALPAGAQRPVGLPFPPMTLQQCPGAQAFVQP